MSFERRMAETVRVVEAALEKELVAGIGQKVSKRLVDALRQAVFGGGKRFRPFLVLESAALFDVAHKTALKTAAAVEFVHCYSLVHDDLPAMDNDPVRRGAASVWAAFDEWTAILVGDGLQALAFEVISSPDNGIDGDVRATLISELAVAAGVRGMVGGQAFDLEADKLGIPAEPCANHIRQLQMMKTGALIRFSCEAGAILGQGSDRQRLALRTFGEHLGYAFQIADDLLDVEGDQDVVGKTLAKDDSVGKATLVSLMNVDHARAELKKTEALAIKSLEIFGAKADLLREAARFATRRKS